MAAVFIVIFPGTRFSSKSETIAHAVVGLHAHRDVEKSGILPGTILRSRSGYISMHWSAISVLQT
jgi:hypothetical protein